MKEEPKKRSKYLSKNGWRVTVLEVLHRLRSWGVMDLVESIVETTTGSAAVLTISHSRFYSEFVMINRISSANFHVNFGNDHYRARTAIATARIVKDIIFKAKGIEERNGSNGIDEVDRAYRRY